MPYQYTLFSKPCSSALYCKNQRCLFIQNRNGQCFKNQLEDISSVWPVSKTHANVTRQKVAVQSRRDNVCTFLLALWSFDIPNIKHLYSDNFKFCAGAFEDL